MKESQNSFKFQMFGRRTVPASLNKSDSFPIDWNYIDCKIRVLCSTLTQLYGMGMWWVGLPFLSDGGLVG